MTLEEDKLIQKEIIRDIVARDIAKMCEKTELQYSKREQIYTEKGQPYTEKNDANKLVSPHSQL